jgi:hypothetical protein
MWLRFLIAGQPLHLWLESGVLWLKSKLLAEFSAAGVGFL